jgi:hypothetical protein
MAEDERLFVGYCCAVRRMGEKQAGASRMTVQARLQSGGPMPFKMAKVTLSWEEDTRPDFEHPRGKITKEVVVNFTSKSQTQKTSSDKEFVVKWPRLPRQSLSLSFCLQIVTYLDEEEDEENSLASDWSTRLNDDYLSDIKVVAGKSSFLCHKLVLASRSDVFKAMFSHGNVKECIDRELSLEDDPTIIKDLNSSSLSILTK